MGLVLKRDPGGEGYEYYLVYEGEVAIGRVFQRFAGTSAPADWFWGVTFKPEWEPPTYGSAETREAAMAAFKERWRRGGAR